MRGGIIGASDKSSIVTFGPHFSCIVHLEGCLQKKYL